MAFTDGIFKDDALKLKELYTPRTWNSLLGKWMLTWAREDYNSWRVLDNSGLYSNKTRTERNNRWNGNQSYLGKFQYLHNIAHSIRIKERERQIYIAHEMIILFAVVGKVGTGCGLSCSPRRLCEWWRGWLWIKMGGLMILFVARCVAAVVADLFI